MKTIPKATIALEWEILVVASRNVPKVVGIVILNQVGDTPIGSYFKIES